MNCESCDEKHDGSYGSGRFCKESCARSYSTKLKRNEISLKVSKTLKSKNRNLDLSHLQTDEIIKKRCKTLSETLKKKKELYKKTTPFEKWNIEYIKEEIFNEQKGFCNFCKNDTWLGELIPLELEHKDGNNLNNKRENLELLCCNCHSLTHTWRGRNKTNGKRVSDKDLMEALKSTKSIRQALLKVGISAKGNNYIRAKKLFKRINENRVCNSEAE